MPGMYFAVVRFDDRFDKSDGLYPSIQIVLFQQVLDKVRSHQDDFENGAISIVKTPEGFTATGIDTSTGKLVTAALEALNVKLKTLKADSTADEFLSIIETCLKPTPLDHDFGKLPGKWPKFEIPTYGEDGGVGFGAEYIRKLFDVNVKPGGKLTHR